MNDNLPNSDNSTPPNSTNLGKFESAPSYYTGGVPSPAPTQHQGYPQNPGFPQHQGYPQNPGFPQSNPYVNQPSQYQNPYQQPNPHQGQSPYQNPYQQPQQAQYVGHGGVPVASKPPTSAVVSFVSGLSNLMFLWIIPFLSIATTVVGIFFSHRAMKETSPPNPTGGRGLGIAGMICNYVSLLLAFGWSILILTLILTGMSGSGGY